MFIMFLVLDDLPEELIVEICGHLDIFDLVAFSMINKKIRTIATTLRSFWIPAIAQSNLFVPLPNHRPLVSYTATELSVAAYRAVKTESNLLSPRPELQSWFHIKWPYGLSADVFDYGDWEEPASAIYMHLSHPNAEWMFMVSSNNIIRILHLRSGNLALINADLEFRNPQPDVRNVSWAAEFRGDIDARFVIGCYLPDRQDNYQPAMAIFDVEFRPENGTARMRMVATYTMPTLPLHIDIAGEYIVAIEPASFHFMGMDKGTVHLVKWREEKKVETPPLGEAIRIAAFQDYFVALSLVSGKLVLHVVGLPTDDESSESSALEEGWATDSSEDETGLTNDIDSTAIVDEMKPTPEDLRVFSYRVPFYPQAVSEGFSAQICHIYTGERQDVIRLWIRHSQHGTWSVFSVNVDFGALRAREDDLNLPEVDMQTLEAASGIPSGTNGGGGRQVQRQQLIPKSDIAEDTRVIEETDLQHYAVPITPGRRLLWWRDLRRLRQLEPVDEPAEESEEPEEPEAPEEPDAPQTDDQPEDANVPSTADAASRTELDASGSSAAGVKKVEGTEPQSDPQWPEPQQEQHQELLQSEPKTMALCIAKTDELATLTELETAGLGMGATMNPMQIYDPGTPQRKQQEAVRILEIPTELERFKDMQPYMFVMEEYSGTILVQMSSGDLWVLRYGKP